MKWSKSSARQAASCLFVALIVFGIDQYIKWWVLKGDTHYFWNGQLAIGPFYNPGIAFSITLPEVVLTLAILVSLVFVVWLSFFELRENATLSASACGLVLGGSMGNIIDRFRHGAVVDYVHVLQTSVFNFADVAIAVGLLIIVILLFRKKKGVEEASQK